MTLSFTIATTLCMARGRRVLTDIADAGLARLAKPRPEGLTEERADSTVSPSSTTETVARRVMWHGPARS